MFQNSSWKDCVGRFNEEILKILTKYKLYTTSLLEPTVRVMAIMSSSVYQTFAIIVRYFGLPKAGTSSLIENPHLIDDFSPF